MAIPGTTPSLARLGRAVGVLHPRSRFFGRAPVIIGRDLYIAADLMGQIHELIEAHVIRFPFVVYGIEPLRPLVPWPDAVLPVVAIGERTAGIPNDRHAERLHRLHHV